jgi:hypothetical protein
LNRPRALLALLLAAAPGGPGPADAAPGATLLEYAGETGRGVIVRMSLEATRGAPIAGQALRGSYFLSSELVPHALEGVRTGPRAMTLVERSARGDTFAVFRLGDDGGPTAPAVPVAGAAAPVLAGSWTRAADGRAVPLQLRYTGLTTLDERGRRYAVAGAESDSVVEAVARAFWQAALRGDREQVAVLLGYPVTFNLGAERRTAVSAGEFMPYYFQVFTPGFLARLGRAMPLAMPARRDGIVLGDHGEVLLGPDGRPRVLDN